MVKILLILVSLCCIGLSIVLLHCWVELQNKVELDHRIEEDNKKLLQDNTFLQQQQEKLKESQKTLQTDISCLNIKISDSKDSLDDIEKQKTQAIKDLNDINKNIEESVAHMTEMSQNAFSKYWEVLEKNYEEKEEEYSELIKNLEDAYNKKQTDILKNIDIVQSELDKIKATKDAVIQANIREKEIEDNLKFYRLDISNSDLNDIAVLEDIKPKLKNQRVLSMLIWQTFYQKPLKGLTANILDTSTPVTGIYKITNINDKKCYIGQAVDVGKRWSEHAKCGLGIDTPANNKLYKAMASDGLYSFSWELLEKCPKEQLNEKEKYYIDLYDSYNYGYNSNKGIGK